MGLGEVDIRENITADQRDQWKTVSLKLGLELLEDKKAILIEKIKNVIVEMINYTYCQFFRHGYMAAR
jgi:hypothetical protein